jgi:hypothetical protein
MELFLEVLSFVVPHLHSVVAMTGVRGRLIADSVLGIAE